MSCSARSLTPPLSNTVDDRAADDLSLGPPREAGRSEWAFYLSEKSFWSFIPSI